MAFPGGFETASPGFSDTVRTAIKKGIIDTLRAGLIALPRGAVVPMEVLSQVGDNFTLRATAYPDLEDGAITDPLTEGVPPNAIQLTVDKNDVTVRQGGAWTAITDISQMQSPANLEKVAATKIKRLAAQYIDNKALTALLAHGVDEVLGIPLSTSIVLDAAVELASRDVEMIPGVGYYCLTHPKALRGLTGEDGLNGYVDVTAQANAGAITSGAVGQYRGVTFLTSTRIEADGSGLYPAIFLGSESIAFGDVGTIEVLASKGPDSANPLAQFSTVGFKGVLGGTVLSFSETTDGAESDGNAIPRVFTITVSDGTGT